MKIKIDSLIRQMETGGQNLTLGTPHRGETIDEHFERVFEVLVTFFKKNESHIIAIESQPGILHTDVKLAKRPDVIIINRDELILRTKEHTFQWNLRENVVNLFWDKNGISIVRTDEDWADAHTHFFRV